MLVYYSWGENSIPDTMYAFESLNVKYTEYPSTRTDYFSDQAFESWLKDTSKPDCIFSFDFFPCVAEAAHNLRVPYISWIYDSPHWTLYTDQAAYEECHVYSFDSGMCREFEGKINIKYMPLGVNSDRLGQVPVPPLNADISFVGSLYDDTILDHAPISDTYVRGYLQGMIAAGEQVPGLDLIREMLDYKRIEDLSQAAQIDVPSGINVPVRDVYVNAIAAKLTSLDRTLLLKRISDKYFLHLYTNSSGAERNGLENCGTVDYFNEMPKIFAGSKINLNITARGIEHGIPLRAMDIMGAGGFLLSDFRSDLAVAFQDGRDLVIYHSPEECEELVGYYLEHEDERKVIATSGCEKVRKEYDEKKLISQILKDALNYEVKSAVCTGHTSSRNEDTENSAETSENGHIPEALTYIILAPVNGISGGPELLHQLAYVLNSEGRKAYMMYYDSDGNISRSEAPEPYKIYNTECCPEGMETDTDSTVVIIPETAFILCRNFRHAHMAFWWLSVNGYCKSLYVEELYDGKDWDVLHIKDHPDWINMVQSAYAYDFLVHSIGIEDSDIVYLSDYINDEFFSRVPDLNAKKNMVAYNPAKGRRVLEAVRKSGEDITWVPIENMTPSQVHDLLLSAKVYVDFGGFPGKDRIPREAAMSGCVVITGREGAANYQMDFPIPDKYKFRDPAESAGEVCTLIRNVFSDFERYFHDFDYEREVIRKEKGWFGQDTGKFARICEERFLP